MIINTTRKPKLSLYFLGSIILKILQDNRVISIEKLIEKIKNSEENIKIDFIYYTLDWLFLLSILKFEEGMICYED